MTMDGGVLALEDTISVSGERWSLASEVKAMEESKKRA